MASNSINEPAQPLASPLLSKQQQLELYRKRYAAAQAKAAKFEAQAEQYSKISSDHAAKLQERLEARASRRSIRQSMNEDSSSSEVGNGSSSYLLSSTPERKPTFKEGKTVTPELLMARAEAKAALAEAQAAVTPEKGADTSMDFKEAARAAAKQARAEAEAKALAAMMRAEADVDATLGTEAKNGTATATVESSLNHESVDPASESPSRRLRILPLLCLVLVMVLWTLGLFSVTGRRLLSRNAYFLARDATNVKRQALRLRAEHLYKSAISDYYFFTDPAVLAAWQALDSFTYEELAEWHSHSTLANDQSAASTARGVVECLNAIRADADVITRCDGHSFAMADYDERVRSIRFTP